MRAAFAYECAAFAYPVIAHDISPRLSREFPPCPHIFTPARASAARSFAFFCGPPPPGRPALPRSDRAGLSPTRTFFTSRPRQSHPARANYVQPAQFTSSLHKLPAAARLYFFAPPRAFAEFCPRRTHVPVGLKQPRLVPRARPPEAGQAERPRMFPPRDGRTVLSTFPQLYFSSHAPVHNFELFNNPVDGSMFPPRALRDLTRHPALVPVPPRRFCSVRGCALRVPPLLRTLRRRNLSKNQKTAPKVDFRK